MKKFLLVCLFLMLSMTATRYEIVDGVDVLVKDMGGCGSGTIVKKVITTKQGGKYVVGAHKGMRVGDMIAVEVNQIHGDTSIRGLREDEII